MRKLFIPAICAALFTPAFAEELPAIETNGLTAPEIQTYQANPKIQFPRGMQIGLGVSSTSGLNGFVGYANKNFDSFWWKRLGVRFDFATTSPVEKTINSRINDELDKGVTLGDGMIINGGSLSAQHMGVLVDFYPFGNTWFAGGLRISGGYVGGSMKVKANLSGEIDGMPAGGMEFELNGTNYRYTGGDLRGTAGIDWNYRGPYLGTGFDLGLFWGIKIYVDAGVVFTSKTAKVGLDVPLTGLEQSTDGGNNWTVVNGSQLDADKAAALKDANDTLDKFGFFPLAKLGFMYRF